MKKNGKLEEDDLKIKDLDVIDDEELEESDEWDDLENLDDVEENESFDQEPQPNGKKKGVSIHLLFFLVLAVIVVFAAVKLIIWNIGIQDDTDISINHEEYDVESMDYILPLNPKLLEGREDDGITTVVCLGNAPFADDRNSEDNLAKLMEKELGENARVYNCSVADSYMTALRSSFNEHAYDVFSFYWLSTVIAVDNDGIIDSAFEYLEDVPEETRESMDLLRSIDFETVDVIAIMYDASDYLGGRKTINNENPTDIQYFTGALTAGIQLIQQTYPHIRIMVMSPTYAYALDENGEYASSDIIDYGMGSLATYAILESNVCYENSVSFIDNIYASVNANNADQYLLDHVHLNVDGRRLLAKRFVECLNLYQGVAAENAE